MIEVYTSPMCYIGITPNATIAVVISFGFKHSFVGLNNNDDLAD